MATQTPQTTALRSCTRLNPLLRLDLGEEASGDDGNHPDPDVRRKEVRRAVKHDVEPPVATQPSEEAFHHPSDPAGQETPVPRSAGRDRDVDVMRQRRRRERCPREAAVAKQIALETERGQPR